MTSLLIADDHAIVRRGLREIVLDEMGSWDIEEVGTGEAVLREVHDRPFDLLLLDITLPDRNGLDLLGEIKAFRPDMPVLVLSMHPENQYALRALKFGASGYLTKNGAATELVHALRRVLGGGKYVSAAVAESLADLAMGTHTATAHEALSNREFTVLIGLGHGKAVRELAAEFGLSVKTISTYRSRLLEKMGLRTNADLVRYVISNQLG